MTGLDPISQTECNTFQLMEYCLTYLKSILELCKGQTIHASLYVKYLSVFIDENLNRKVHI